MSNKFPSDSDWFKNADISYKKIVLLAQAQQALNSWTYAQLEEFNTCLRRLKVGEPFIAFRAQDMFATDVAEYWLECMSGVVHKEEKITSMKAWIEKCEAWQDDNDIKVPD